MNNSSMLQEVENKVAYARARTNSSHPEYNEAWASRYERLCEWRDNLLTS